MKASRRVLAIRHCGAVLGGPVTERSRHRSLRSPPRALNSPGLPRDPVMQITRESA